jgi:hypothetical protein
LDQGDYFSSSHNQVQFLQKYPFAGALGIPLIAGSCWADLFHIPINGFLLFSGCLGFEELP